MKAITILLALSTLVCCGDNKLKTLCTYHLVDANILVEPEKTSTSFRCIVLESETEIEGTDKREEACVKVASSQAEKESTDEKQYRPFYLQTSSSTSSVSCDEYDSEGNLK